MYNQPRNIVRTAIGDDLAFVAAQNSGQPKEILPSPPTSGFDKPFILFYHTKQFYCESSLRQFVVLADKYSPEIKQSVSTIANTNHKLYTCSVFCQ